MVCLDILGFLPASVSDYFASSLSDQFSSLQMIYSVFSNDWCTLCCFLFSFLSYAVFFFLLATMPRLSPFLALPSFISTFLLLYPSLFLTFDSNILFFLFLYSLLFFSTRNPFLRIF